uniref:Odorant-binding protein n=1 Tax=Anoplophora chinensis TaxID=217632 RepID=A0A2H4ZB38_ANOCN|nr:odorant-binding protein [Anoplophora chinensis]
MVSLHFFVTVSSLFAASVVQAALPQSEYGPQLEALQKNVRAACISTSGVDETAISNVGNGVFTDEPKIKHYMTCVLKEGKLVNEKGVFSEQNIAQLFPDKYKEESLTNIKSCIVKVNDITNLENKIFAFIKCYYHQNPDLFVFF